ncbi:MAG: protease pro-enzyme activation domain-containing protein [Bryobacteraceae bacterium]
MLASVANTVCDAQSRPLLTQHVREATLNGQARFAGRLPEEQHMRLVLVLPLRDQAALDQFLKDLYQPSSPSYRRYLKVEEFTAMFGPTQQDYNAVLRWAETNGFTVVGTSRNRMNVDVTGSVATIEAALHVNMGLYQHPTENRSYYAPDREPTVDLPFQLWRIAGLDNYSIPHPTVKHLPLGVAAQATTGSCPEASFCGSDMRAAYYGGTALTGSGQSLGLLEYLGTDLTDLATYYTNAGQTTSVPITLVSTDGTSTSCSSPDCDDTEQTIDMTQALGMAPGLSSLVMYVGSTDAAIFNAMATADPLNAQLSSSWIWSPADPSTDNPYFQEFAAQGQNLFQAAGDGGAWSSYSTIYPADDAYLTSVGGTDLKTSSPGGPWSSETTWVDGGGGISPDHFAIPFWQTTAASGCSSCSTSYRNAPDVAANANFSFYVCADQAPCTANLYGGTSFAAPMWAGYLALVNQQAVADSKPTLGFINPALYDIGLSSSYDADFHDITSGSNGYSATTGYDLATGWGSPQGSGLVSALLGTIKVPGFGLTASPAAVSLVQGSSATFTITSTVINGFDSSISLSATGQPTGVTVAFSPSSITGAGTTSLKITVGSSTAIGTYRIKVAGTSGGITEVVAVSLIVTKAPANFAISASPTSISVDLGASGTYTITTSVSGGFDSAISLSATGYPTGVTVSFSPGTIPAPGSGKSTMKVTVGKGVVLGDHTITINAIGAGVPRTAQVTLDVLK